VITATAIFISADQCERWQWEPQSTRLSCLSLPSDWPGLETKLGPALWPWPWASKRLRPGGASLSQLFLAICWRTRIARYEQACRWCP